MNRAIRWIVPLTVTAAVLIGCGGSDSDSERSSAAIDDNIDIKSSFTSIVDIKLTEPAAISSIEYKILPKPGLHSKPVFVKYSHDYLSRNNHISQGTVRIPIFGLYSAYNNSIDVTVNYKDGSSSPLNTSISTPAYDDPTSIYSRLEILKARAPTDELGFNYFFVKNRLGSPVIYDTDGQMRWVGPGLDTVGIFSTYYNDVFVQTSNTTTQVDFVRLNGSVKSASLDSDRYIKFHHTTVPGKVGIFGQVDARLPSGVINIETEIIEFDLDGHIIKSWDLSQIISDYMTVNGDDPSGFVRDGVDWLHTNDLFYDSRDDSIIISARETFVIKIDYESGKIKWLFGDPEKLWYSYPSLQKLALSINDGGLFPIGQHGVSINSDGNLMLFNNGRHSNNQFPRGQNRDYSVVSIYKIDEYNLQAENIVNYEADANIYSSVCSGVDEVGIDSKSLLVSYAVPSSGPSATVEDPRFRGLGSSGELVFDFQLPRNSNVTFGASGCSVAHHAEPIALEFLELN